MRTFPAALLLLGLLAGCGGDDEIRLYWVPKALPHDHPPRGQGGMGMGSGGAPPATEDATWSLPAGWEVDPEPKPMRYVTLRAGEIEVAVTQFPGPVGTVTQNVERWRGQLGLEPAPPHALQEAVVALEHPQAEAALVDLRHEGNDQRLWVATLRRPSVTWFVKTQGTVAQVEAQLDGLRAFVASLRFVGGAAAPGPEAGGHAETPSWQVAASWEPAPAQPPRLASYRVGAGEATVTTFPGAVGDLLSNVNRWRGQLGLAPVGDLSELDPPPAQVQVGEAEGTLIELRAADQGLLVAFAPHGGQTWFFKLTAPLADLSAQREAFGRWVGSVDFHPGHAHGDGSAPTPPGPTPPAPIGPAPLGPGPQPAPLAFTAPGGWTEGEARPPRLLTLRTPGGAELSVTRFGGAVGDLASNVARWRGQLGLPPGGDVTPPAAVVVDGAQGQLIELIGAEQAMRVASVPHQGETWFFKLMGPAAAVQAERGAFDAFLASVDLP